MKITNRNFKVFVFGIIAFIAIESIYKWEESTDAFMRGYNSFDSTITKK